MNRYLTYITYSSFYFICTLFFIQQIFIENLFSQDFFASEIKAYDEFTVVQKTTNNNSNTFSISGQKIQNNMSYKFKDFILNQNDIANFNDLDIYNSVVKVQGKKISKIDGTINSNAVNFYFCNPNGIIIGENAYLNTGNLFLFSNDFLLEDTNNIDDILNSADNDLLTVSSLVFLLNNKSSKIELNKFVNKNQINIFIIGSNITLQKCDINLENRHFITLGDEIKIIDSIIKTNNEVISIYGLGNISISGSYHHNLITLQSNKAVRISGKNIQLQIGQIELTSFSGKKESYSGDAHLNALENIYFENGSSIESNAAEGVNGGNININAGKNIIIDGAYDSKSNSRLSSQTNGSGNGGKIELFAKNVMLTNGGQITTNTLKSGNGGDIIINSEKIICDGKKDFGDGTTFISGIFSESTTQDGNAGSIQLNTSRLSLLNGATISTSAESMATAGKINIYAKNSISMQNGIIESNVKNGIGAGGDILLTTKVLAMINSKISVNADKGDGGDIYIVSEEFFKDSRSTLEAFSNTGKEGKVKIELLNSDKEKGLSLPKDDTFLDSTKWIRKKCSNRYDKSVSQYLISSRDGSPMPYDDWLDSGPVLLNKNKKELEKIINAYDSGKLCSANEQIDILLSSTNNKDIRFDLLQLKVHLLKLFGHYDKAFTILKQCKSDFTESKIHKALIYNNISDLYLLLDKKYQAIKHIFEAKEFISDLKSDIHIISNAAILNNEGNNYAADASYITALYYYEQSYETIKKADSIKYGNIINPLTVKVLINQIRCIWQIKLFKEKKNSIVRKNNARPDIEKIEIVKNFLNEMSVNYDKLWHMNAFGVLLLSMYDHSKPLDKKYLYKLIQKIFIDVSSVERHNKKLISCAYGYLSTLYLKNNQYSQAIKMNRSAIEFAQWGYYPEISFQWHWQSGKIFYKQGKLILSEKEYFKALFLFDPLFSISIKQDKKYQNQDTSKPYGFDSSSMKSIKQDNQDTFCPSEIIWEFYKGYRKQKDVFYDMVNPFYMDYMELLIKIAQTEKSEKLNTIRMLIERLNTINIQNFYKDECYEENIDNETPNFSKNTAVIYPFTLHNKTMILFLRDKKFKIFPMSKDSKIIKDLIKKFINTLRSYYPGDIDTETIFNDSYACTLYDLLINPLKKNLSGVDTLIIVPDRLFRTIPFSALKNRALNNYLIEEYALCTVPSFFLAKNKFSSINPMHARVFFGGLSKSKSNKNDDLPGVIEELKIIKTIFTNKDILINNNFTKKNLLNTTKNKTNNIWHLSTHYFFEPSIDDTYMELYDNKISVREFESLFRLNKYHQQTTDLLFLNACDTAKGDDIAILGLGGIALRIGVKCAIATLWPINDIVAALMTKEFYNKIYSSHGITNIKALQYTKKQFIKMNRYKHPHYWASYIMIGI